MNPVDIGVIAVVLVSSLMGVVRGLTREVLGLTGWVGAAALAFLSLPSLRHIAQKYITNPMLADSVTLLASFCLLLIAFNIVSHILSGYVKDSSFGSIDRTLGLAFGVLRGAVILGVLELGLSIFVGRDYYPPPIRLAKMLPYVIRIADGLTEIIPQRLLLTVQGYAPKTKAPAEDIPLPSALPPQQHTEFNTQNTVDGLANLKPKQQNNEEKDYDAIQRGEMNRLVQTVD